MKRRTKALLLSFSAVLLVVASVLGTMAYLTDKDAVTNTFTVGQVNLNLDEADVKTDGSYENGHDTRVEENEYHLLPGHTYYKDPTVTVTKGSEDAYVRMIVQVDNIDQLKAALPDTDYCAGDVFLLEKLCVDENGEGTWDPTKWNMYGYTQSQDGKTGYYEFRYYEVVKQDSTKNTVLPDLFTHITVPGTVDNTHLANLKDVKITVTAHAIQADGFDTADKAWGAFDDQMKT